MRPLAEAYRRHDLLDVEPGAWAAVIAERADLAGVPHVAAWVENGRPVILRRSHPGEDGRFVPVGLPLPPRDGKRRIGLALPPEAVRPRPPVLFVEALAACPPPGPRLWRRSPSSLGAMASRRASSAAYSGRV